MLGGGYIGCSPAVLLGQAAAVDSKPGWIAQPTDSHATASVVPTVEDSRPSSYYTTDTLMESRDRLADPSPTSLVSDQVLARVENEDLREVHVKKAIDAYATRGRIQVEVGILCAPKSGRRKCSGWHHVSGYRDRLTAIFLDDFL